MTKDKNCKDVRTNECITFGSSSPNTLIKIGSTVTAKDNEDLLHGVVTKIEDKDTIEVKFFDGNTERTKKFKLKFLTVVIGD